MANMMSYSVSPGIVKFETIKGSVKSFDLTFINQGENSLKVEVKVMDLRLDKEGVPVISKISTTNDQWGRFVKVSNKKFSLKPKKSKKINVSLTTPRSAKGSGYFAVVFNTSTAKPSKALKSHNVMSVGSQMPVLFLGEIARLGLAKIEVSKAVINKPPYSSKKPLKLRFSLRNMGTTHVNVDGDLLLRYKGKVVERLSLESGSGLIIPNGERYFVATSKKFSNFLNKKLQAEARFSFPGGRANKKITFLVK